MSLSPSLSFSVFLFLSGSFFFILIDGDLVQAFGTGYMDVEPGLMEHIKSAFFDVNAHLVIAVYTGVSLTSKKT